MLTFFDRLGELAKIICVNPHSYTNKRLASSREWVSFLPFPCPPAVAGLGNVYKESSALLLKQQLPGLASV